MRNIFINTTADRLKVGNQVRAKSLRSGRFVTWLVSKVTPEEVELSRKNQIMRVSSGCKVLLPITQDPHLS